jgi:GAF domain-containing protein
MRNRDRTTYEEWGSLVAAGVADRLESNADRARAVESVDERERVGALESLGVLDQPDDARFAQITDSARALFGVESASINFIDENRQWVMALSGTVREDVPRTDAICDVTITRPGAFVINDAIAHPRFRDLPMVREGRVRFYAGYPIEAPNGMRVGALCLTDPTPRAFSRADEALLRELAMRVQAVLRQGASA